MNSRSLFGWLVCSLSLLNSSAFAFLADQPPQLPGPDKLNSDLANDPESAEAFFMLSLYEHGKAGGNTGICVDFSTANGKPEISVGLSSDAAFDSGKAEPKDKTAVAKELKDLFTAFAKTQGTDVIDEVSVTGYADGVRYSGGNRALAERRAQNIGSLLTESSLAKQVAAYGVASQILEQRPKNEQSCEARRRVVISFPAKENKIKIGVEGRYEYKPGSFGSALQAGSMDFVKNSIDAYAPEKLKNDLQTKSTQAASQRAAQLTKLQKKNPDATEADLPKVPDLFQEKTDEIYSKLMNSDHKISPLCDQFPLKELTKSLIYQRLKGYEVSDPFGPASVVGKKGKDAKGEYLEESNPEPGKTPRRLYFEAKFSEGNPASVFACFNPSEDKDWKSTLAKAPGFCTSGSAETASNKGPDDSKAVVAFDTRDVKGYKCLQCGKGYEFEKDGKGLKASYDDRLFKSGSDQGSLLGALNAVSDDNAFSLGASLKPRMFVVDHCSCNAADDVMARIKEGKGVQKIDPLEMGSQSDFAASLTKGELKNSCIVRPPVLHTCNVKPIDEAAKKKDVSKPFLTYLDPLAKSNSDDRLINSALIPFTTLDQLQKGFATNAAKLGECALSPSNLSTQEKVNSVACNGSARTKLPTVYDDKDCPVSAPAAK